MKRLLAILLIMLVVLSGCADSRYSRDFFSMDTIITATVYGKDETELVRNEVERLDSLLSVTNISSDVAKHNRGQKISDETKKLIKRCEEISTLTGGAFDIHLQALIDEWDVANATEPPSDAQITKALDDKSKIGFGAVAKGYAAACIRKKLEDAGVESAVVSLGGNVMLIGNKPGAGAWSVGIQHPTDESALICTVEAADTAVVTSGGYQRYFEHDGVRYHHILDPKTGYPAKSGIISATVITKDDTLADALSTAVYVMGVKAATELYRGVDGIELIMVTEDTVHVTEGLDFTLEDSDFKLEVIKK